ncbi:SO_0444 family Cu/Zn efflux transporter [Poseidonibacter sp.]|uniref:SO_0444 family Cu/Zn efflux transporter n=1 Tax=Poseidonibacter sp. TaxID=2321188 RepID=UPI003C77953F
MELMLSFADNFLVLLNAMSIYILVGLLFAGILKQLIPNDFVIKHLGKGNISSVLKATLFGIPLPVCSCSVIPLAQGLRKEGASKGAVQSFLISTPITGVDSILATFSFFGLIFTVFRVISSIIIAISVGLIQNFVDRDLKEEKENEIKVQSCYSNTSTCSSDTSKKEKFSIKKVFSYAYVTLFKDMAKTLFIGLLLGAAFTTFAPKEYTQLLFENEILTYIVIMLFAMPLYVCATASLPIAAALMLQGMSGGAAFIFLTAGPATSAITMSVVYKSLGKKALIVYVSTIAIMSFAFGWFFDIYFGELNIISFLEDNDNNSIISNIASLIMLILMSYYLIKPRLYRNNNIKENDVKVQNDLKVNNKIDFKNATFKKRD